MISNELKTELLAFAKNCRENHIPVLREKTASILCGIIKDYEPKTILELGTAVGYSGTLMLKTCESSKLVTVDMSEDMCNKAHEMFLKYGVSERVQVVNDDILHFLEDITQSQSLNLESVLQKKCGRDNIPKKFDLIFLDGPKGQYIKYYPYLKRLISENGIIFCDDVLYFGMVLDDSKVIHKKITIVRNLREFLKLAQNDTAFESELLDVEDGVLILKKLKTKDNV